MGDRDRRGEQTIALALLGAVLFSRPVLDSFGSGGEHFVFGIPAFYLYLFVAWGALIGLLALVMEFSNRVKDGPPDGPTSNKQSGPGSA